jgi:hypothetical protein
MVGLLVMLRGDAGSFRNSKSQSGQFGASSYGGAANKQATGDDQPFTPPLQCGTGLAFLKGTSMFMEAIWDGFPV